jgi:hypothetical protein
MSIVRDLVDLQTNQYLQVSYFSILSSYVVAKGVYCVEIHCASFLQQNYVLEEYLIFVHLY